MYLEILGTSVDSIKSELQFDSYVQFVINIKWI